MKAPRSTMLSLGVITVMLLLTVPATGARAAGPDEAVDAFHRALAEGDRAAAEGLLSPDLVLFEDGEAELSRDEYASHHLKADIKFSRGLKRELVKRSVWDARDNASVSSLYKIKGRSRGKAIRLDAAETMVLERSGEGWRIVHIHWSNHVRK